MSNASIAARIDALEVAVGGTFTQAAYDELRAISAELKPVVEAPAPSEEVTEPALVPLRPSKAPKADK